MLRVSDISVFNCEEYKESIRTVCDLVELWDIFLKMLVTSALPVCSYVCDIQFMICSCFYPNCMCGDSFYATFFKGCPKGQRGFTVLAGKVLSAEKFQIESHCMKQTEFPWERYRWEKELLPVREKEISRITLLRRRERAAFRAPGKGLAPVF